MEITLDKIKDEYIISKRDINDLRNRPIDGFYKVSGIFMKDFIEAIANAKEPEDEETKLVREILSGKTFHILDAIRFLFKLQGDKLDKWK